jgi:alkanesulfonate monooxygenase SsuD/methylene tetrahydromethanopterin reductase-like flavin-dependent oxidoreductase (luciferase family)
LRWLAEALPIMRGMLDGTRPTTDGDRYTTAAALNLPAPIQEHVPILIGGSGRKVTLRLVAEYADACNMGGASDDLAEKDAALVEHCEAIGRDETTIERTVGVGSPFIRDSREEAYTVMADVFADNGNARTWTGQPVGTVEDVVEHCKGYLRQGYRHLLFGFPAPHDEETMTRLATEVRPQLEAFINS